MQPPAIWGLKAPPGKDRGGLIQEKEEKINRNLLLFYEELRQGFLKYCKKFLRKTSRTR